MLNSAVSLNFTLAAFFLNMFVLNVEGRLPLGNSVYSFFAILLNKTNLTDTDPFYFALGFDIFAFAIFMNMVVYENYDALLMTVWYELKWM